MRLFSSLFRSSFITPRRGCGVSRYFAPATFQLRIVKSISCCIIIISFRWTNWLIHISFTLFYKRTSGTSYNDTKLRGIEVNRATYLLAKSAKFLIKWHLTKPLERLKTINLVPLGTSYLFPTDICTSYSLIIEYGCRILSNNKRSMMPRFKDFPLQIYTSSSGLSQKTVF